MLNSYAVLDLDGVLADFEGKFCEVFGYDHRDLIKLEERYPERAKEIAEFTANPETYQSLEPIELGLKIAKYLTLNHFKVCLVSSRPSSCQVTTIRWVNQFNIEHEWLIINPKNKMESIKKINPLFAVDDIPSIAEQCEQAKIRAMLVKQPWNENSGFPVLLEDMAQFRITLNIFLMRRVYV
jgi:hypothetical protein